MHTCTYPPLLTVCPPPPCLRRSCTGGKTEDFVAAAKLMHQAGGQVKVPTYLVPATQKVRRPRRQAVQEHACMHSAAQRSGRVGVEGHRLCETVRAEVADRHTGGGQACHPPLARGSTRPLPRPPLLPTGVG